MADNQQGFFGGLLDALMYGAKNTGYAIQDDLANIKEGQLPQNLMRDLPGLVSMLGQGAVNPQIPALQYWNKVPIPEEPGIYKAVGEKQIIGGGNWLDIFTRQGGFGNFLSELVKQYEKAQRENP